MNIIIIGAGKFGRHLALHLCQEKHDVIVVDKNPEKVENLIKELDVQVICGNGANYEILENAECNKADVLIAATSQDEVNILSCLFAKKIGAKETIARVRNPEYAKQSSVILDELGIGLLVNPELDTAEDISRMLRFPSASTVETFANGKVDLVQIKLTEKSPLINNTLFEIHDKYKLTILVCAVQRGENVYIPNGNFVLKEMDNVYIAADDKQIKKLFSVLNLLKEQSKTIMIIGGGKISYYLAKALIDHGLYVKIIDKSLERCKQLSEELDGAIVIHGEGTNQKLLLEEGLGSMDALVCLTNLDETNIIISTFAQEYNKGKIVTKINKVL